VTEPDGRQHTPAGANRQLPGSVLLLSFRKQLS
jgi:hypothetical protein